MFKQINKVFFIVVTFAISGLILVSLPQDVSAFSATLTTSSDIKVNASPSGDGTSIHEESINIVSDCRSGYNLSIATPEGSNLYADGNTSNPATFTAVDGTSALNSTNNTNKWGYTLTTNPTSNTVFLPLSSTQSVLKTSSQTASPTTDINDTFSINYGVKVNDTVTPGSYKMKNNGSVVYYLTMAESCNVVDIAYDGNNADAGTMGAAGTGVIHTSVKDGDTIDLIASNFSKDGYGFAGWSLDKDAGTKLVDNDNTNNPIVYGPQETITLPDGFIANDTDNDNIVKLYAVWIESQGSLQGWIGCSDLDATIYDSTTGALDLTKNSVTALTDQRDNDTYAVARLADGNCWMIENLRLADKDGNNNPTILTTTNTNNPLNDGTNVTLKHNYTYTTTSNTLSPTSSVAYNASTAPNGWCTTISAACYDQSRIRTDNTANRATNPTTNSGSMYSYGNYYNWYSATAGNGTYNFSTINNSVAGDLCPAGWHLPKGGSSANATNSDFWQLGLGIMGFAPYNNSIYQSSETNAAGKTATAALRSYPNNYLYSGYVNGGSLNNRGSNGNFWSSTAYSTINAYFLRLNSSGVFSGTNLDHKYYGYTVRCIASEPQTYTLFYDANGGTGAPSSQSTTANGIATFTLNITTPTRSGYTFAGWTDEVGNEAQPGDTFTIKDPNATLYAIWTNNSCNPTATTIGTGNTTTDAVCLQDVTPSMKSSLPTADATTGTYTLIDARDNQSYTVAKLADGNLWLTKNLNYGSNSDTLLTSHDTDLPSNKTFKSPASTTAFETANNDTTYISPKILANSTYGGYYSYAAATASTNAYSTSNQNITTSICPKGWDLPTSTIYNNLRTVSGNTSYAKMSAAPYSFKYAGYRSGTSFSGQTNSLRLWTSTNYSSSYAYYTTAYGTATYSSNYKRYGESVRCIASNGTVTINYEGNGTTEYPVTGTVASQTNVDINSTNTQPGTVFTRTNWAFSGWNTAADGTGTTIAASTAISTLSPTPGSTVTLYAQWLPQYNITYVDNCKSWATSDTNCTDSKSATTSEQKVNLTNNPSTGTETSILGAYNKFTMTGWKIKEWTINADGTGTTYPVSSTYIVPAGSSVGDGITLYAHWAPIYTVQYDGNGSDNDSTGMGSTNATTGIKTVAHTNVAEGDTFDLFASNFKRAGYGFVGWSTDSDAWNKLTDNDATNDAKIWGPNEIITAPAYNGTPITTLYAIWAPAETSGGNPVYLQSWTGCSAMTATTYDTTTGKLAVAKNSITALTDERDGNVYTIAKLADENCWMVENLRLADTHEESGSTVATTLTTANTNILASNNTLPITNIYNADSSLATKSNSLSPSSSVAYNASSAPYGWCTTDSAACDDQSRLNTTNTVASIIPSQTQNITSANAHTDFNNTIYAYGNYYNWYSATAGYGTYSRTTSEPTAGDLCPAGWKLPYGNTGTSGTTNIGGTKGGFSYLDKQMGGTGAYQSTRVASNKWRMFPNNFIYVGYWRGGSTSGRGYDGYYWSASACNSNSAYTLYLNSTYVSPGSNNGGKYNGSSVRCIASPAS